MKRYSFHPGYTFVIVRLQDPAGQWNIGIEIRQTGSFFRASVSNAFLEVEWRRDGYPVKIEAGR